MAFNFNNTAAAPKTTAVAAAPAQAPASYEKAAGYLNISVPLEGDEFGQVGKRGLPLLLSDAISAELVQFLDSLTPEQANDWLTQNLRITYWSAARDTKPTRRIKFG